MPASSPHAGRLGAVKPSTGPLLAITQLPDAESAERLARALVEARLAACVNVLPGARSFYRWQGEVQADAEQVLLIKTRGECWEALERLVRELHPYELPGLYAVPVTAGLPAFLEWTREQTRSEP